MAHLIKPEPGEDLYEALIGYLADDLIDASIDYSEFLDDDPVRWIETHFRIPETDDNRIILQDYQKAVLRQALTLDAEGNYPYSIIVWSDIKKSIKCVSPDTMVRMWDGSEKRADEICINDEVIAISIQKDKCSWNPVKDKIVAVERQPVSWGYKITTSRGRSIKVSSEHPFLSKCDNGRYPSYKSINNRYKRYEWIEASKLKKGDRIAIGLQEAVDIKLSHEYYALGAYIGDGGQLKFTNDSKEVVDRFKQVCLLKEIGGRENQYSVKGCVEFLKRHGISDWKSFNSYTKRVPQDVFMGGSGAIVSFLSGYLDTDGCVVSPEKSAKPTIYWGSVNRDLLSDCQKLLEMIGVNATLRPHPAMYKNKPYISWLLVVQDIAQVHKLATLLDLAHPEKRRRLEAWSNKELRWKFDTFVDDRIVSIEPVEIETIAIQTEKYHSHITNGLVTHNSTVAAAVVLWRAFNTPWATIKIIANDLKQADSRVSYYARRAIELHPRMRQIVKVKASGYSMAFPNHAIVEAIPVDPQGEAGGNDDMLVYSELWGAKNKAALKMWSEATLSPTKFGKSFRWIETYAGFSGESPILEQLYQTGIKQGEKLPIAYDFDPELEVYENKPARMLCMWNGTPRMPWQSKEYYASEEAVLAPQEFLRMHRNQWVSAVDAFIPIEWWDSSVIDKPMATNDNPHIMALDAAVSNDSFAIVLVCNAEQPTQDDNQRYYVRYSRNYMPPKGGKIDFTEVEKEIRRLLEEYNVSEIAYDPYQLEDMANRLRQDLVANVRAFNQGKDRLIADKALQSMIRDRMILHAGEPNLREHLNNANGQASEDGHGLRLVKRNDYNKIDLAVALSMATYRATILQI